MEIESLKLEFQKAKYHTEQYKIHERVLLSRTQTQRDGFTMRMVLSALRRKLETVDTGYLRMIVRELHSVVYHRRRAAEFFENLYDYKIRQGKSETDLRDDARSLDGHLFAILQWEELLRESDERLKTRVDYSQIPCQSSSTEHTDNTNKFRILDISEDSHTCDLEHSLDNTHIPSTQHSTSKPQAQDRKLSADKPDEKGFDCWIFRLCDWLQSIPEVVTASTRLPIINRPFFVASVLDYIVSEVRALMRIPDLCTRQSWVGWEHLSKSSYPFLEDVSLARKYQTFQTFQAISQDENTQGLLRGEGISTSKGKKPTKGQRRNNKVNRIERIIKESRTILELSKRYDLGFHTTLGVLDILVQGADDISNENCKQPKDIICFYFAIGISFIRNIEKVWSVQSGSKQYNDLRDAVCNNFRYYLIVASRLHSMVGMSAKNITGLREMEPSVEGLQDPLVIFLVCGAIDMSLQQSMGSLLSDPLIRMPIWLYCYHSLNGQSPFGPDTDLKSQSPETINARREIDVFCERHKRLLFGGMRPESIHTWNISFRAWLHNLSKPKSSGKSSKPRSMSTSSFETHDIEAILLFENLLQIVQEISNQEKQENYDQSNSVQDQYYRALTYLKAFVPNPTKSTPLIEGLLKIWHQCTSDNTFTARKKYVDEFGLKDVCKE